MDLIKLKPKKVQMSKEWNREYMRIYNSIKISCECGRQISKGKFQKHTNTTLHFNRIASGKTAIQTFKRENKYD